MSVHARRRLSALGSVAQLAAGGGTGGNPPSYFGQLQEFLRITMVLQGLQIAGDGRETVRGCRRKNERMLEVGHSRAGAVSGRQAAGVPPSVLQQVAAKCAAVLRRLPLGYEVVHGGPGPHQGHAD